MNYSPYGFTSYALQVSTMLFFNGEYLDKLTGLYSLGNGHRAFSPTIMRFYSPDLQSPFLQGGVNCYCYCSGDPINFTDPTGQHRKPLKRINANANRPPTHSGNPTRVTLEIFERNAENTSQLAQRFNRLKYDASRKYLRFRRAMQESITAAHASTTDASVTQHLQAAKQNSQQATHYKTLMEQHSASEQSVINALRRIVAESQEFRRDAKENIAPLPASAQTAQADIRLPEPTRATIRPFHYR
ncbi:MULTISPECIES: RHS repeat-associated core domain-containing protein [Pseudomonas]|jgi:RHS repeat-associated protein|uniref:RHS repeat-associated core domain-containing protein n=1 Tax=Pseudomonas TaxID=286 RepID=UPI00059B4DBB|nr:MULTISPECIES: RHS repeat-associated core domain-containing protein [Pseudomonas]HBK50357.1 RHS repeat-associated core domain-containing protein [Pseudomonas sp.]AOX07630.1 RHS repeat-associated core domain-containing protein [Pseudomonas putida JB]MCI1024988.1 RHS repeat-associated core domain-containing protein [Pseudomonas putida]MDN4514653.1 RHS repeat-associated core domain-containing protein [Pseudomonas sp. 2,4-D]PWY43819.1 RHS repeat-associated core domain-containing protein [Pseudom